MRVYVATTSDELLPYRRAACEAVDAFGGEAVVRSTTEHPAFRPVRACAKQVSLADLVIAIVGWTRGPVPDAAAGGDELSPWVSWELRAAFENEIPVAALLADKSFGEREKDHEGCAVVQELRAELTRLGVGFSAEPEGAPAEFRQLVRRQLELYRDAAAPGGDLVQELRLRSWPQQPLPERPYPLLLPIAHPKLLAGRSRELKDLRRRLTRPIAVTGVYAPSGTGKSSFLDAGLVRGLRAEGKPAALDRHPCEAGIAARLLGDLAETASAALNVRDDAPQAFMDALTAVRRRADAPPVLVIDQFEEVLRRRADEPAGARAAAVIGGLLAASVQRVAGLDGPACRWVLSYREEFEGQVYRWLSDVLRDAQPAGMTMDESLPRDLSGPLRFQSFSLSPLGTPPPGTKETIETATEIFRRVIEDPLTDGRYPWRFAKGDAQRLARAFGEARMRRPTAPLAPELQVVLAYLLEAFDEPASPGSGAQETIELQVPEDPGELIDDALGDHLRRSLDLAFPAGKGREVKTLRTRALLALRELADAEGRRSEALPAGSLAQAIGEEGVEVLEKLATASTRLVVPIRRDGEFEYALSHDRLAEVLVRVVDEGRFRGLEVDRDLLELRRFAALQSELFAAGEEDAATEIPRRRFARIEKHREALLRGEKRERWWTACRERRRKQTRRKLRRRLLGTAALLIAASTTWYLADQRKTLDKLFTQVAQGDPESALAAADALLTTWERDPEEIRERLRLRERPLDVLERGIGGLAPEGREIAVLRTAEAALPLIVRDAPEDPERIASLVWALDFFAPKQERTRELRDQALAHLRAERPPPVLPQLGDPLWIDVPAGAFLMGAGPHEGRDDPNMADELPQHLVTLSAFRLGTYETTNAEFRRLYPKHASKQDDRLPADRMSWYAAYTYAAWLGGRLPTEAEAEYVRRGGCEFAYCKRDGSEAPLSEVAWWTGNSADPESGEAAKQPVGGLEPNPWGFFDLYGNVNELCADWYGLYSAAQRIDPTGPTDTPTDQRTARGGSAWMPSNWVVASGRIVSSPQKRRSFGLRVLLPADSEQSEIR